MSVRRVAITPYDLGFIAGAEHFLKVPLRKLGIDDLDANAVMFTSLLQTGADQIRVPKFFVDTSQLNPVVRSKVFASNDRGWFEQYSIVERALKMDRNPRQPGVIWFFASLLNAVANRSAMFWPDDMLTEKSEILGPTDVVMPMKNILRTIVVEPMNLPITAHGCSDIPVKVLKEVLSSREFSKYRDNQIALNVGERRLSTSIRAVQISAKRLVERYSSWLRLQEIALSVIPVGLDVVSGGVGRLTEAILKLTGNTVVRKFGRQDRVSILNFSPVLDSLLSTAMATIRREVSSMQAGDREEFLRFFQQHLHPHQEAGKDTQ